MLVNTQLRYTPYKHQQIHRILCAMIAPRAYRPVNPTTQRLVQRIMEDWWAGVSEMTLSERETCRSALISQRMPSI